MEKKGSSSPRVTINCACGAEVVVDPRSRTGVYICRSCKAPLTLTPAAGRKKPSNGEESSRGRARRVVSGSQEVACRCGERLQARIEQAGRQIQCPRCGRRMRLEKVRDPQTLDTRIRAADLPPEEAPSRGKPEPPAKAAPAKGSAPLSKIPTGARKLSCRCGASLMVLPEHMGKEAQCPQCGLVMRIYSFHDPQTGSVTITAEPSDGKGGSSPAAASLASQEILCQCGEHLLVQQEHLGRQVQCAGCGTIMKLEKGIDPLTSAPIIQARVVGKVDLDSWSLDDFK